MRKMKSTKRALLLSALALLMCVSMLIGTTYAWFTDSVTSGSNVITAGNLDIDVQYTLDGETWKDLSGATDLFQKGLWEPGHTEVVALKITNKGTLALKYAASMNIFSETVGKTKDGQDIVLSDILTVSTLTQQANDALGVGDITLDLAFNGENSVSYENPTSFNAGNVLGNDVELLPGAAHYVIIKVDMAETVGNEANHDGEHVPTIEFGINVLATQYTHEYDSFDNQYDVNAGCEVYVKTFEELLTAVENGGIVNVTVPMTVTETLTIKDGTDVVIKGEELTLDGTDQLVLVENGTLTLENVTLNAAKSGRTVNVQKGGTLIINDGAKLVEASGSTVVAPGLLVVGDVIMNGGEISNCTQGSLGSAVYMGGGTFTMNGGKITGCVSKNGGGAVAAQWNAGKFIMNGGEITGNESRYSGAIQIDAGINVELNGGKIYDNKIVNLNAEANPSNVTLKNGTLSVSGGIEIYNTDTSVKSMVVNKSIVVTGALTGKIQIYSATADFVVATGTDTYTLTESDLAAFENTAEGYELALDGNSIKVVAE